MAARSKVLVSQTRSHNLTSPKWKEGGNGEVVSLDEEGFVHAEIRLGAFPGHQKVGSKSLKVCLALGWDRE